MSRNRDRGLIPPNYLFPHTLMKKKSRKKRILENIRIDNIGYGWVGIGTLDDGKKVIVKWWALPWSIIDLRVTKNKKDFVQGHISKIKKTDPAYTDGKIFCPHYFTHNVWSVEHGMSDVKPFQIGCGGCKRQVMSYAKQLELKEKIVLENFQNILKTGPTEALSIIGSPLEKNYRNKIEFSFWKYLKKYFIEKSKDQSLEVPAGFEIEAHRNLWFHKQGEFSKIVDVNSCGLISDKANSIFQYIKKLCKDSWLPVHDQKTHFGFFRHLVIREGVNTDQILVNLVIADQYLHDANKTPIRNKLKQILLSDDFLQKSITTFVVTTNNGLADIVKGQNISLEILRGNGHIFETLCLNLNQKKSETIFRVSPFSFFQTNTFAAQQLFSRAAELIDEVSGTVLDLYCGTGSIGLSFLNMWIWNSLIGIEIVEESIKDAKKNAENNDLAEQSFFVAWPAEKVVHENKSVRSKLKNLWLVIIDPPREGLHKEVIKFLIELKKEHNSKLLYISCNPVTMARDISLLIQENYQLQTFQPIDMFPQTHHIECIGILY